MSKVAMHGLTFDCIEVKCNVSNGDTMHIETYDDELIFRVGDQSNGIYVGVKDVKTLITYLQTWVSSR